MYQLDHLWKTDSWYQWSRGRVPVDNVDLGLFFPQHLAFINIEFHLKFYHPVSPVMWKLSATLYSSL